MTLHYFCFFVEEGKENEYHGSVAADLKVKYVANAAKAAGCDVKIFALNKTKTSGTKSTVTTVDGLTVKHISSRGGKNLFTRIFNRISFYCQIAKYFIRSVGKGDVILLYHSLRVTPFIAFLKKFARRKVVLEVEEIYACAADGVKSYLKKEIKAVKKFDRFIFVNNYIPEDLGVKNENYTALYGVYEAKEMRKIPHNGVRVLYAGAVEKLNKGAFKAVETAQYLPSNYSVHIIGKGTDGDEKDLLAKIENVNKSLGRTAVCFDGFKTGIELDEYMYSCDIGLGAYPIKDKYSNYIFPSKLVGYTCRGLKVVTGRAECYERTPFADNWFFYDSDEPECIAEAIVQAANDTQFSGSGAEIIKSLDENFKQRLIELCS